MDAPIIVDWFRPALQVDGGELPPRSLNYALVSVIHPYVEGNSF